MKKTLTALAHRASSLRARGDAVVLVYHRIAAPDSGSVGMIVSPERFAEHLDVVRRHFRPLPLADLVYSLGARDVPPRSVAITFDDGYSDNLDAAKPLLELHEVPSTVFVVSGYVDSDRRFWWDELERICIAPTSLPDQLELDIGGDRVVWNQAAGGDPRDLYRRLRDALGPLEQNEREESLSRLREWCAFEPTLADSGLPLSADRLRELGGGGLVEIGAHTVTHPNLTRIAPTRQLEEISGSAKQLEAFLDRPVQLFSYPFGAHDRKAAACVREAGLASACTTEAGALGRSTDRYRLPRLHVGDWSGDDLHEYVAARLR